MMVMISRDDADDGNENHGRRWPLLKDDEWWFLTAMDVTEPLRLNRSS